jgi:hypothetical protein
VKLCAIEGSLQAQGGRAGDVTPGTIGLLDAFFAAFTDGRFLASTLT